MLGFEQNLICGVHVTTVSSLLMRRYRSVAKVTRSKSNKKRRNDGVERNKAQNHTPTFCGLCLSAVKLSIWLHRNWHRTALLK